jgi:O-antigen ligase
MTATFDANTAEALPTWRSGTPFVWAMALTAFALPLIKVGIQIPIALLVLTWLVCPKAPLKQVWKPILLFSALYLFHVAGMLYTENTARGLSDLGQKLSLIIMPVLIGTARTLKWEELRLVLMAFVVGTVLEVVISFVTSTMDYAQTHDVMSFYMSEFSPVHHPGYVAMYMDFALAILLMALIMHEMNDNWQVLAWAAVVFVTLSLVFPASKIGLIDYGFLLVFVTIMAYRSKALLTANMAVLLGVAILFGFFLVFDPVNQSRLAAAVEAVTDDGTIEALSETESNQARLVAWRIALDEIVRNPLGVGTGDINDAMVARYQAEGYHELAEKELNPHNHFLQIALAQGIPALLVFLFSLAWPFVRIYRDRNWLYAFFLISIAMHMMVESMLEKQSGVIYFAFFNALLFFSPTFTRKYLCVEIE